MRRPTRATVAVAVTLALGGALAACSDDDDTAVPAPTAGAATVPDAGSSMPTVAGDSSVPDQPDASAPTVPPTRPTIPEEGVPGLDSDLAVCRAWSRFGGSFQVVAVAASFGSGDPFALEVVAAPTVVAAYDGLLAAWPAELAAERELVADSFLGPFARRAERARQALVDAGADDATLAAVDAAWLAALAERDPASPDLAVDLPDDVWALVDAAAADLGGQVVPVPQDPSLVTDAEVPLTEAFLAERCPDQGTLLGDPGA